MNDVCVLIFAFNSPFIKEIHFYELLLSFREEKPISSNNNWFFYKTYIQNRIKPSAHFSQQILENDCLRSRFLPSHVDFREWAACAIYCLLQTKTLLYTRKTQSWPFWSDLLFYVGTYTSFTLLDLFLLFFTTYTTVNMGTQDI